MIHDPLERWARALMTPDAPDLDHECTEATCTHPIHLPDRDDVVWSAEDEDAAWLWDDRRQERRADR